MTTTAPRRARPAPAPYDPAHAAEEMADAGVRARARAVLVELTDSAAAQAREAAHQVRCIHELWLLALEDREIDRLDAAGFLFTDNDRRVPSPPQSDEAMVLDVADEIAPALKLSAATARERVREALVLAERLPGTLEALEAGRFSARHAGVLAEQWRELVDDAPGEKAPADVVRRLVAELQELAPHCTVAQLRIWARRRREALLTETQERRHRAAREGRRVWVEDREDGMACLHALLTAPVALAAKDRLEALVDRLPAEDAPDHGGSGAPGVPRTRAQLRADVLGDLLLAGEVPDDPDFPRDVRGEITVTVPVLTLLARGADPAPAGPAVGGADRHGAPAVSDPFGAPGASGEPGAVGVRGPAGVPDTFGAAGVAGVPVDTAVLVGHGPIDPETARELAGGAASWHRVLTHPTSGVVLDHDRTVYAVPADLKRRLRLRDGTCRFPGCRRRAARCDLDHTVAWADGGPTAADNLAHLCRHHHLVKHRDGPLGRWTVRQLGPSPGGGVLEWTSPAGATYRTVPDPSAGLPPDAHPAPPAGPADPPPPPFDRDDPPPF
ncbi:DUF222 domain-containing protein [Kocuria sp. M1R5S2]|uniref:DUF222 domain-containing protein n=1 Tax=Kocuria rhizosphaerae TaxID=3376285 RepID=UPI0037A1F4C5